MLKRNELKAFERLLIQGGVLRHEGLLNDNKYVNDELLQAASHSVILNQEFKKFAQIDDQISKVKDELNCLRMAILNTPKQDVGKESKEQFDTTLCGIINSIIDIENQIK